MATPFEAPPGSVPPRIDRLVLPASIYEEVITHLEAARPFEGVGLLAVSVSDTDKSGARAALAERFYPGTNLDASPSRYTMDPAEVLHAMRDIDAQGWTLGAIVHSHMHGPATPSVTDVREARYPGTVMLIVAMASEPLQMRGWRLEYPASGSDHPTQGQDEPSAGSPSSPEPRIVSVDVVQAAPSSQ